MAGHLYETGNLAELFDWQIAEAILLFYEKQDLSTELNHENELFIEHINSKNSLPLEFIKLRLKAFEIEGILKKKGNKNGYELEPTAETRLKELSNAFKNIQSDLNDFVSLYNRIQNKSQFKVSQVADLTLDDLLKLGNQSIEDNHKLLLENSDPTSISNELIRFNGILKYIEGEAKKHETINGLLEKFLQKVYCHILVKSGMTKEVRSDSIRTYNYFIDSTIVYDLCGFNGTVRNDATERFLKNLIKKGNKLWIHDKHLEELERKFDIIEKYTNKCISENLHHTKLSSKTKDVIMMFRKIIWDNGIEKETYIKSIRIGIMSKIGSDLPMEEDDWYLNVYNHKESTELELEWSAEKLKKSLKIRGVIEYLEKKLKEEQSNRLEQNPNYDGDMSVVETDLKVIKDLLLKNETIVQGNSNFVLLTDSKNLIKNISTKGLAFAHPVVSWHKEQMKYLLNIDNSEYSSSAKLNYLSDSMMLRETYDSTIIGNAIVTILEEVGELKNKGYETSQAIEQIKDDYIEKLLKEDVQPSTLSSPFSVIGELINNQKEKPIPSAIRSYTQMFIDNHEQTEKEKIALEKELETTQYQNGLLEETTRYQKGLLEEIRTNNLKTLQKKQDQKSKLDKRVEDIDEQIGKITNNLEKPNNFPLDVQSSISVIIFIPSLIAYIINGFKNGIKFSLSSDSLNQLIPALSAGISFIFFLYRIWERKRLTKKQEELKREKNSITKVLNDLNQEIEDLENKIK